MPATLPSTQQDMLMCLLVGGSPTSERRVSVEHEVGRCVIMSSYALRKDLHLPRVMNSQIHDYMQVNKALKFPEKARCVRKDNLI